MKIKSLTKFCAVKKGIYILVFVILIIVALLVYLSDHTSTFARSFKGFELEEKEEVTSIALKTLEHEVKLKKQSQYNWTINEQYRARLERVEQLLNIAGLVEIVSPAAQKNQNELRKEIQEKGTWLCFYEGNRELLSYYLYQKGGRIFAMADPHSVIYILRIIDFKGNANDFFNANPNLWRSRIVFDYEPQQINSVDVEYKNQPTLSFSIRNNHDGSFELFAYPGKENVRDFDPRRIARYLSYFRVLKFEKVVEELSLEEQQEILQEEPKSRIAVTDGKGNTQELAVYPRPMPGNPLQKDVYRAYGRINQNNELVVIQFYIFDPILKDINYFRSE